jgi:hypothetical protein
MFEYSILATGFTVRRGGWLRTTLYVIVCIAAVARFWQVKSYTEAASGMFAMVLAAAVLAPGIDKRFMLVWRQRWFAARETVLWLAPVANTSEQPAGLG